MFYVFSSFIVITQLQKIATNQGNDNALQGRGENVHASPRCALKNRATFIKAEGNILACRMMHIPCSRLFTVNKTKVSSLGVVRGEVVTAQHSGRQRVGSASPAQRCSIPSTAPALGAMSLPLQGWLVLLANTSPTVEREL